MALCLAESLVARRAFDAGDQLQRYARWRPEGHHSSTGRRFDIGNTVREALGSFVAHGDPERAGIAHQDSAGDGALMRPAWAPAPERRSPCRA